MSRGESVEVTTFDDRERRFIWISDAVYFVIDWVAFEIDAIEWEFPVWDPPEGRFEPRASQPI